MTNRSVATLLTPRGRGAIASLAVDGPDAARDVQRQFHSATGRDLSRLPVGGMAFGRWGGERGEEVVVARTSQGVEIHCHGGAAATRAILASLQEGGVQVASDEQAWLAARWPGAIERQAVQALTRAATRQAAAHLLAQAQGALRRACQQAENAIAANQDRPALEILDALLADAVVSTHLVQPWRVVLSGEPNVGKSSLINRIVGYQRAIVYDQPGTTRDVVSEHSPLAGWPVQWTDTAGIREADDPLEQAGVQRAREARRGADVVLRVFDAGLAPQSSPPASSAEIAIYNKCDLQPPDADRDARALYVSALTGEGVPQLLEQVEQRLLGGVQFDVGKPLLFRPAHVDAIRRCREALAGGDRAAALGAMRAFLGDDSLDP